MTDLSSLIAKLEQAESGSRALDAEIEAALNPVYHEWRYLCRQNGEDYWTDENSDAEEVMCFADYTTSIDAALALIPEGHFWAIATHDDGEILAIVRRGRPTGGCTGEQLYQGDESKGATPALALASASLKARSRVEGK